MEKSSDHVVDRIEKISLRFLKRDFIPPITAGLIYLAAPLAFSCWYISQITLNDFSHDVSEQRVTSTGATSTLTSVQNQLSNLEQKLGYIEFLGIKPDSVFYNLYVENFEKVTVVGTDLPLPNSINCISDKNPFGAKHISKNIPFGQGKIPINTHLRLSEDSENTDIDFVNDIFKNCALHPPLSIVTDGLASGTLLTITPGSGVKVFAEPERFMKVIITLAIMGIWWGALSWLAEGFPKTINFIKRTMRFLKTF